MFLWFIKKFMKNSYKKYLEELDEFNHLKMEIIKNCDYYNKVGTTQYHFQCFNTPRLVKIEFKRNNKDVSDKTIFTIVFKEKAIPYTGCYFVDYETYNIFYNGNCLSKKYKKKALEFIKEMIFNNESVSDWDMSCDKIIER